MTDYRLTDTDIVVRISDSAWIPNDPGNADWVRYLSWVSEGGVPDPYTAPPEPVPSQISDRQFFQQLAVVGIISEDDALASNAAVIPPALLAIISSMPEDQQFTAKMLVGGATVFDRHHPMTEAIGYAYGWTSDQIDDFFRAASLL